MLEFNLLIVKAVPQHDILFKAYHSKFTDVTTVVGNMAVLPIRSSIKGPAPRTGELHG